MWLVVQPGKKKRYGRSLLHHGLQWAAGGQPVSPRATAPGASSAPPSSLTLVPEGLLCSVFILISPSQLLCSGFFCLLLNITEFHQHHWWAQLWAVVQQFWDWPELAVSSGDKCGGNSWCLLTEVTPAAPLLPKLCHINPIAVLLKGSDLYITNTQNVSWWSSELLCVLQLHIREKTSTFFEERLHLSSWMQVYS